MYIERVQVDEGFLDGLDISFSPGLNVIIGARGTGKTSIIELIRFCLGVSNNTQDSAKRSREHAMSVLGSGQVTVTLSDGQQITTVTRTVNDAIPRATSAFEVPVIFSQTEIETVGLEAAGRLRLIDGFISFPNVENEERDYTAMCRALTQQIELLRREIDEIEQSTHQLPALHSELAAVLLQEGGIAKTSELLSQKTQLLNNQSSAIAEAGVFVEQIGRYKNDIAAWSHSVKHAIDTSPTYQLKLTPEQMAFSQPLVDRVGKVFNTLKENLGEVLSIYNGLQDSLNKGEAYKIQIEDTARQLRKEIDSLQSGAGDIMRKGQGIRESIAKLSSLQEYSKEKRKQLVDLINQRSQALDALDQIRYSRSEQRQKAAEDLNKIIGPNIRISIIRNGQVKAFSSAIAEALRGSGLRYADIAERLAHEISPRLLLEAVDNFDTGLITDAAGITEDRASRILSHLKECELGDLGTIRIEDEVFLQLLDGNDYKDISDLSTGQRCTVVLPLVLAHMNRMLIVDQPEDHIDNAFIAETLIKVILSRGEQGQIIFSTHNPNIPVLGDADTVVHMGSDGRRGFKIALGALSEEKIVSAISNVMEGGALAFSRRAEFYGKSLEHDS